MSLLRPGTFFTWRAFTTYTCKPRASRISYTGIQYTPVDSIATVSTPQAVNQSARACRSGVKVPNLRTGSAVRSGATAAQISSLPISRPAALGWITFRPSQALTCDLLATHVVTSTQWNMWSHPDPVRSHYCRLPNGVSAQPKRCHH